MKKLINILILPIGLFVGVFLHELLHFLLHYKDITSIQIFPNWNTIVQMNFHSNNYNTFIEEFIAYAITFITVFVFTLIFLSRIDKNGR